MRMPPYLRKYLIGKFLLLCVIFTATGQPSVPVVTIYRKDVPLVHIEKSRGEYRFYRIQDGSCLGRWDGRQVYVAQSHVQKGVVKEGRLLDAQQNLLYLIEETPEGNLLLKHPLAGPCWVVQADLPLLPGTNYYWQWHIAPDRNLLYAVMVYFVYFHPTPLC